MIPATIIHTDELWQTIWTSAVAGIALCVVFAIGVLGATKSSDAANDGNPASSIAYGLIGIVCAIATLGFAAYGIVLIAN